jgi:hypothetical protein
MRPYATSVCGLKLQVYEGGLKLPVHEALSYSISGATNGGGAQTLDMDKRSAARGVKDTPLSAEQVRMLTYADVCCRMLTYADKCLNRRSRSVC